MFGLRVLHKAFFFFFFASLTKAPQPLLPLSCIAFRQTHLRGRMALESDINLTLAQTEAVIVIVTFQKQQLLSLSLSLFLYNHPTQPCLFNTPLSTLYAETKGESPENNFRFCVALLLFPSLPPSSLYFSWFLRLFMGR